MRFVIAVAVSAVFHVPIVTAPREPDTATLEIDLTPTCCFRCGPDVPPEGDAVEATEPMQLDGGPPVLTREMAIEAALTQFPRTPPRPWIYEEPLAKPQPRREFEVGYVNVRGELDRKIVRRFVRFHAQELSRCNHMKLDEVSLTVDLFVGENGSAKATVRGDESAVNACVERELRAIEFPRNTTSATQAVFSMTLRPHATTSYAARPWSS